MLSDRTTVFFKIQPILRVENLLFILFSKKESFKLMSILSV